jgi:hypothetical protein
VNSGPSAAAVAVALVGFATGASAVTGGARSVGPVTEAVAESAMVAAAASPPFTAAGAASSLSFGGGEFLRRQRRRWTHDGAADAQSDWSSSRHLSDGQSNSGEASQCAGNSQPRASEPMPPLESASCTQTPVSDRRRRKRSTDLSPAPPTSARSHLSPPN